MQFKLPGWCLGPSPTLLHLLLGPPASGDQSPQSHACHLRQSRFQGPSDRYILKNAPALLPLSQENKAADDGWRMSCKAVKAELACGHPDAKRCGQFARLAFLLPDPKLSCPP